MDYFYDIEFQKGVITVLGADEKTDFVSSLKKHLENIGTVSLTDDKSAKNKETDFLIIAPDKNVNKRFKIHSEADIEEFKAKGMIIGVVSVEALLKDVKDAVIGAEVFCEINNMEDKDLVYPLSLARVISNREKYDMLYIDDVSNMGRRYTAREINRRIKYGAGVRMVNTDSDYVEVLQIPFKIEE